MPIQFVGQWCNDNREGSDSTWQLPSWHKGNHARKYSRSMSSTSLMVDCPANPFVSAYVKTPAPVAHPYTAVVTAAASPTAGALTHPERVTFRFERYIGNLWLKNTSVND